MRGRSVAGGKDMTEACQDFPRGPAALFRSFVAGKKDGRGSRPGSPGRPQAAGAGESHGPQPGTERRRALTVYLASQEPGRPLLRRLRHVRQNSSPRRARRGPLAAGPGAAVAPAEPRACWRKEDARGSRRRDDRSGRAVARGR